MADPVPSMHLQRATPRLPSRLCGLLGLWLSLVLMAVVAGHAPEAAAKSTSRSKGKTKKKKGK